jgi:hypothetical protein
VNLVISSSGRLGIDWSIESKTLIVAIDDHEELD